MMIVDIVLQFIAFINRHSAVVVQGDLPLHLALAVNADRLIRDRSPICIILALALFLVGDGLLQDAGNRHVAGMDGDRRFRNLDSAIVGNHFAVAIVLDRIVLRQPRLDGQLGQHRVSVQFGLDGIGDGLAVGQRNAILQLALDIEGQQRLFGNVHAFATIQLEADCIAVRKRKNIHA